MKIGIFNHNPVAKSGNKKKNNEKLVGKPKRKNSLRSIFKQTKRLKPRQQFFIGGNLDAE